VNVCQLERAKQDIRLKDDSLRKLEDNCQNLENKAKGKEQFYKNLQEKVHIVQGNTSIVVLHMYLTTFL
jgi:kinesin family protein C2/C3